MKKYQEGDIIYANKKTYVCEMAHETKAIFKPVGFSALRSKSKITSDDTIYIGSSHWSDSDKWLVLEAQKCPISTLDPETGTRKLLKPTDYSIIGRSGKCCSTVWNLQEIARFPELLKSMAETLTTLVAQGAPTMPMPVPDIAKTAPAKRSAKKATKRR